MRDLFEVRSSTGVHPVRLAEGRLRDVVAGCEGNLVIADAVFRDELGGGAEVLFVEAVEESKDLARMPALIEACRRAGLTRDGGLVALGGGVVQDIACFIASVYMRGVRWTYVPTTLLAMVDSCIGGKSSINVGEYKNLVGTFYPPAAVVIAPAAVETLPEEHVAGGRCEAAKICFARGDDAFERYLALDAGTLRDEPGALIAHSLEAKKWFVEIDEFDHAERLLLNFGHSFGHALESCTTYAVPHGVAVGIGCLAAVEMSCARDPALRALPRTRALSAQLSSILAPIAGLGATLATIERAQFFRFWDSDKKHSVASYRPILLDGAAHLYRETLPRDAASADAIWNGFTVARAALTPA